MFEPSRVTIVLPLAIEWVLPGSSDRTDSERSNPRVLQLGSLKFTQEFYDELFCVQSIKTLGFQINSKTFDFDFLLKLKSLQMIELDSNVVSIEFICKMVKQLKCFAYLRMIPSPPERFSFMASLLNCRPNAIGFSDEGLAYPFRLHYELGENRKKIEFGKNFRDEDELIQEIKEMAENEQL